MERRQAIFFDRDGTLVNDPEGYLGDWEKITLLPRARETVQAAKIRGYRLFLITNQSGVGRGFFPLANVHACHRRLLELLGDGALFTEIGISTGTPDCPDAYRKPSPRFPEAMIAKYGLQREHCWVIGNGWCDMEMAARGKLRGLLVHDVTIPLSPAGEKACQGKFLNLESAWDFLCHHDG